MPKMSDTMTEGVIVSWLKKVGDDVKSGDILAEVETDKATMELENFVKGTLLHIGIPVGATVPVDAVLAIIGKKGEDISGLLSGNKASALVAKNSENESTPKSITQALEIKVESTEQIVQTTKDSRLKVSPLARKIAENKGVDIKHIMGSGDLGRIVKRDVEGFNPIKMESPNALKTNIPLSIENSDFDEIPVSQMRKAIARRLSDSKNNAPHFYLTMEIKMDKAIEMRKSINEISESKISMNDILVKAVASALRKNPKVNSSWLGDRIRYNRQINIGVAVAIDDGLIVPVVKSADTKNITSISAEIKQLAEKAKNKKLQAHEFEGNTFTISNLGMFGIDEFTAIINSPDACILAVAAIKETVLVEKGEMKIGSVMKVTLSCDHRLVDGAIGANFLKSLKELIEKPVSLLI